MKLTLFAAQLCNEHNDTVAIIIDAILILRVDKRLIKLFMSFLILIVL